MRIVSRFPYLWPHLNFGLAVGENNIDESDIPLAAHGKLEHLSKPGPNGDAPISGYEPSQSFIEAAEKLNPKRAARRMPRVATLRTLAQDPMAPTPADKAQVEKSKAEADQLKQKQAQADADQNKRR